MAEIVFELVSPERVEFSGSATMVVLPGFEGLIGVLAGHAPLISLLRPGMVDVHKDGSVRHRFFVEGGFAEITAERCVVLAEGAVPAEKLDAAAAAQRLEALRASGIELETFEGVPVGQLAVQQAILAATSGSKIH